MPVNVLGYQFDDIDDSDILTNHWILTERGNGTLTKDLQAAKAAANKQDTINPQASLKYTRKH